MRRFLTLVCLLCVAIPAGISISGCTRNPGANYCNGLGYGLKVTDVASIFLSPQTTGISLAFGQTQQLSSPTAKTCKGDSASVGSFAYGTTNNQLLDISPSGNMCAGTWNRNTGGGIANYTICSFPNPLPTTNGLPYGSAFVTASANSVTSNPVQVFVHPQVTSISLVTTPTSGTAQQCYSQSQSAQLDAQACYASNGTQYQLCAPTSLSSANYVCPGGVPKGATIPSCTSAVGTLSYSLGTSSLASINQETNQITAEQPGTTVVTASIAGGASSAGFFSVCPPESISIALANGSTTGTITQGVQQNLTTTVTDTQGNPLTGLALDYQTTDPIDIGVGSNGGISAVYPGVASIFAVCQPGACNSAPINKTGLYGTGLPITSNPVTVTTPGTASDYLWFSSPGQSQYFSSINLLEGTAGSTVRLPYVPNSMVMDRGGQNLYFGSPHELMVFSTSTNTLSKQDPSAPGVVLAVAPNGSTLLINDPVRQLFYIYAAASSTIQTFGGLGNAAAWTPDSKTLYIAGSLADATGKQIPTVFVYNLNTGWTSCSEGQACAGNFTGAENLAITIPGVGAYLSGNPTVSRTWCPSGTAGGNLVLYPEGDHLSVQTDVLAATTDGKHILGASVLGGSGPITVSDIGVSIPTGDGAQCPGAATGKLTALSTSGALDATVTFSQVNARSVNQVVASPTSSLAFLTFQGASTTGSALLPYYVPGSKSPSYLPLTGAATIDPVAGAFTPDDAFFFVSTAGDNLIHYISVPAVTSNPLKADTQQIAPNLPACTPVSAGGNDAGCTLPSTYTGTIVPTTAIAVKPRSTT